MAMAKIVLAIFVLFAVVHNVSGLFRITKVHCESYNKSAVVVNKCRLRAISRGVTKCYINLTLPQTESKIDVAVQLLKRANGYKPFLINLKIDACDYLKKRNNPIINLIYGLMKDYTNLNHTCPYVGHQYVDGLYLRYDLMNQLPLPDGEYGLIITWYLGDRKAFSSDVYFEFQMN